MAPRIASCQRNAICGAVDHRFRDCSHAYSNKIKQQDHGGVQNLVDFESLENTLGNVASFVNQQDIAQDVMSSQGNFTISLLPQSQRVAEDSISGLPKEDLPSSSELSCLHWQLTTTRKQGEEAQRDNPLEGFEIGLDIVISTPDKEAQKQKGNILLEIAEACPLSLSFLSGTSTSDSRPDDNIQESLSSIVLPTHY